MGVTLALKKSALTLCIDDAAIQGVKIGMMGHSCWYPVTQYSWLQFVYPWSAILHHLLHLVTLLVPFSSSLDGILIRIGLPMLPHKELVTKLDLRC